mmetsp:Transcript_46699/g.117544  ORF Transcript_46699/g.117544 Transcript_46699/m.117544 type:complete len:487 (-) Transcript_46699:402-1862(-)
MPVASLMVPAQRVPQLIAKALRQQLLPRPTLSAPLLGKRKIKCLTLNVLASPVPFNRMEDQRLRCLLGQIKEERYDVVAFQELAERHWYGVKRKKEYINFVHSLRDLGYVHHVAGPAPRLGAPLDGGTAIFSRHPIVSSSLHPWERQVSWDSFASKGVVQALLEVAPPPEVVEEVEAQAAQHLGFVPMLPEPAKLHVVTLHAQASHAGWQNTAGEDRYRRTRLEQMRQLTQVLREEAKDGEAVLAFGDFNFDARDLAELALHQSQFTAGTGRRSPPLDVIATTFNGDHPATFGLRDEFGNPLETFLTTKSLYATEQCLDHVYFWPAEPGAAGYQEQPVGALGLERVSSQGYVHSEPRCKLEICPYTGPPSRTGRRPTQVSDHYGWSVEFDLAWRLRWAVSPSSMEGHASSLPSAMFPRQRENWLPDDWLPREDPLHLRLRGILEDRPHCSSAWTARQTSSPLPSAVHALQRMWQWVQKSTHKPVLA